MTKLTNKSFTQVVIGDVLTAIERLKKFDTPTNRRDVIRTIFAAVEGLQWRLRHTVLVQARSKLTAHEYAAMREESYTVSKNGIVEETPRFLPLQVSLRLVVNAAAKYRNDYTVDFSHQGWSNLTHAIEVRNRLMHPKSMEDLFVSKNDVSKTISEFHWTVALVIEILRDYCCLCPGHLKGTPSEVNREFSRTATERYHRKS